MRGAAEIHDLLVSLNEKIHEIDDPIKRYVVTGYLLQGLGQQGGDLGLQIKKTVCDIVGGDPGRIGNELVKMYTQLNADCNSLKEEHRIAAFIYTMARYMVAPQPPYDELIGIKHMYHILHGGSEWLEM